MNEDDILFVHFGSDVVGLFPAMQSANSGKIVRKKFEESEMIVKGFKFNHGLRYIKMNTHLTSDLEEIEYLLPKRRSNNGSVPSMAGSTIRAKEDDPEAQWCFPKEEDDLTFNERRNIIARTAEIGVRVIFENFTYRWGGDVYKQSGGGPIGCRVTMAVARIVMQVWSEQYRKILENSGILIAMMKGYVDDNRQLTRMLAMGMRFNEENNKFEMSEDGLESDIQAKEDGEHVDQRMARICRPAMASVNPDLDFTVETAKDYKDGYLPTLDFKTKMTPRSTIIHTYFQKPMKTPFILMECSAMGEQQKHQILTNELIRRLSLVDKDNIGHDEVIVVIEQFIQEMKSSGYKRDIIREVVVGVIKGWKQRLQEEKLQVLSSTELEKTH